VHIGTTVSQTVGVLCEEWCLDIAWSSFISATVSDALGELMSPLWYLRSDWEVLRWSGLSWVTVAKRCWMSPSQHLTDFCEVFTTSFVENILSVEYPIIGSLYDSYFL